MPYTRNNHLRSLLIGIGIGTLLDITGRATRRRLEELNKRNPLPTPTAGDGVADAWRKVGDHMRRAMADATHQ
jgi:hypothetical protein